MRLMVASRQRNNTTHRIFWKRKHNESAEQYNYAVRLIEKPCLRRYFDFQGEAPPLGLPYRTTWDPVTIEPGAVRCWVIHKDGIPLASFTNASEAWFVVLALNSYEDEEYSLEYKEIV